MSVIDRQELASMMIEQAKRSLKKAQHAADE